MVTITIKATVVAKERDFEYQIIVFENLENAPFGKKYIMLTCFPNWQSRIPDVGEKGYVTYNFVEEGIDKWYDSSTGKFIPYNYTNLIFIKFVKEVDSKSKDIII